MMQSERGEGGGSEEMRQNQRLQPLQGDQQQQQPPPQPQKCPRCDSFNTKFCYYNNYSLSQPRYFCKTCRRYWTQGGTQRNVPVGGGCRKGKRTKTTSSGENSGSSQPNQPPPPQNFTAPQTMSTASSATSTSPAVMRTNESGVPSMGSYYPGGGFLSSLAAIQSLQPPPPQPFNRPVSLGGDLGGSSNLGLLQGFNVNVPSFGSNLQINQQRQFYQMGADREKSSTLGLMYPSDQHESLMMQSSRPAPPSSSQHNWHQNFINNNNPNVSDHSTMWSTGSNNNNTTTPAGSSSTTSLNPNPWPRLPGYGAPP